MFQQFTKILFFLLLAVLNITCLDEIELEIPETEPVLTVSGAIYNTPGPYIISITRSAQFESGPTGFVTPVTDAIVKIFDDIGYSETLEETEDGKYQTINIQGEIGRTYHLEITIGDKTYLSIPEALHPITAPEDLSYGRSTEDRINQAGNFVRDEIVHFYLDTPLPNDSSYIKWNSYAIYEFWDRSLDNRRCFVKQDVDLDRVEVLSTRDVNGDYLQQHEINRRLVDFRFAFGYCIHVQQQSITKNAYEFWSAIAAEFERNGSIFETPPSPIRGNIYNPDDEAELILGYFGASAIEEIAYKLEPNDVGAPRSFCRWNSTEDICNNCLLLPQSTLTMPDCW